MNSKRPLLLFSALLENAFQPCWAGMTTANPADASRPTLGQLIIVIRKVPRGLLGKWLLNIVVIGFSFIQTWFNLAAKLDASCTLRD